MPRINKTKALQLWEQGYTDKQIAEEFGCSERTVANWRHNEGKNEMPNNNGIFNWYVSDEGELVTW